MDWPFMLTLNLSIRKADDSSGWATLHACYTIDYSSQPLLSGLQPEDLWAEPGIDGGQCEEIHRTTESLDLNKAMKAVCWSGVWSPGLWLLNFALNLKLTITSSFWMVTVYWKFKFNQTIIVWSLNSQDESHYDTTPMEIASL